MRWGLMDYLTGFSVTWQALSASPFVRFSIHLTFFVEKCKCGANPESTPTKKVESDLRPISLTPVLSKHLKSIIGEWLLEEIGDKLDPEQFGVTKGLSTTDALINTVHHWYQDIHDKEEVRVLLLDYLKAFDLVDHTILVQKFESLGIDKVLLRWLCGFLSDRQQRVKLGQSVSDWLMLKGAMPQGSYFGPLSFIVFIMYMPHPLEVKSVKYADDTTLSELIKKNRASMLQETADEVLSWFEVNKMKINESDQGTVHF